MMELTKKQFDVLVYLKERNGTPSQREIASGTEMSLGSVHNVLNELAELSCIEEPDHRITPAGEAVLETYRVKRAVFMAAGFGSRMLPITLNTPKPLVRIKGKRIIDTLLDAVVAAGIEEIYIVRGYLAEQFDSLLRTYPHITFIENPAYNVTNNISSAYAARHMLANSYVFEADLVLYNPKLITRYQYRSNYLGVPTERTDDWCFLTDASGCIRQMLSGGTDCYHMFGISYWTQADGERLGRDIAEVYENMPGGKERFWDAVALNVYHDRYRVHVTPCSFSDIKEIDTFDELKELDSNYAM